VACSADGQYNVNPGASQYTHPVDDLGSADAGSAGSPATRAAPADWPLGAGTMPGINAGYSLICETCHTPHPAANIDRPSILVGSGTHILRASEDPSSPQYICNQCHDFTGSEADCHPADAPTGRMSDSDIGAGDETLTCSDCHFTGAHNWTGLDFGPDADQEPRGMGPDGEVPTD
jgi:hypothetical protein